jgi:hypothetical protein
MQTNRTAKVLYIDHSYIWQIRGRGKTIFAVTTIIFANDVEWHNSSVKL